MKTFLLILALFVVNIALGQTFNYRHCIIPLRDGVRILVNDYKITIDKSKITVSASKSKIEATIVGQGQFSSILKSDEFKDAKVYYVSLNGEEQTVIVTKERVEFKHPSGQLFIYTNDASKFLK